LASGKGTTGGDETRRVETTEIERTSWLKLRGLEAEWIQEVVTRITRRTRNSFGGGVVIQGRFSVMWDGWLGIGNIGTVDLELHRTSGDTECGTSEQVSRSQELDGVVEVEFLHGATRRDRLLRLGNDHVLWSTRQSGAFIGIQVDVLRVNFIISGRWSIPGNSQFDIVVLERDQWDRGLPVFTERESKGIESSFERRRTIWTLARVLGEDRWGDVLRKVRRLVIDDLATDQPLDLLNSGSPFRLVERGWGALRDVAVSEEIPLAFETNGGDTASSWNALEHLAFYGLGKICVTSIVRPEKTDFRLADEVGILGTDGDELGNTTRHFIYIEVIFLNGYLYMMVLHHVKITRSCFDQLTSGL
tara:strand:+ start:7472 stop:8554 length:1083 start_codon:yes stop_codon:yes gene_type:complete